MKLRRRTVLGAAGASASGRPRPFPRLGPGLLEQAAEDDRALPARRRPDGLGRLTAQALSEKLGQQIIIQNVGGASGTIGSEMVRRAEPAGYTILFNASLFVLGKTVVPSRPYDPQTDFRAIAQVGEAPLVMLANNNVPGNDYAAVMAAVKADPKKFFVAISSGGAAGHIATLAWLKRASASRSTRSSTRARRRPRTDLMWRAASSSSWIPSTALLPLATSGRAKGLFVTSKERTPLAPNIPTSAEVGLKDFNLEFLGTASGRPSDTPEPIVNRFAAGMAEVSKDKAFIDKTTPLGIVLTGRGLKDFAAFIKQEVETNTALLKEANFKPE